MYTYAVFGHKHFRERKKTKKKENGVITLPFSIIFLSILRPFASFWKRFITES